MFYKKGCNVGTKMNLSPINVWDEKAIVIFFIIIVKGPFIPFVSGEGFRTSKV